MRINFEKAYNNIFIKNFPPQWSKDELVANFSKFGPIKSAVIMMKRVKQQNAEDKEMPIAFVCYEQSDDPKAGFACAKKAVADMHDELFDGFKLYVQ
jgi:RNA recognition motif-containing protein